MKIIISGLLAAVFVLTASPSVAVNNESVDKLIRTKKCPKCDLRGAKLRGANLRGAKFCGTTMPNGKIRNDNC